MALDPFLFRWKDIKMHGFDGADHRTYVDLKVILKHSVLFVYC